jgi:hypothetical protein
MKVEFGGSVQSVDVATTLVVLMALRETRNVAVVVMLMRSPQLWLNRGLGISERTKVESGELG